jgi:hypothetical protein
MPHTGPCPSTPIRKGRENFANIFYRKSESVFMGYSGGTINRAMNLELQYRLPFKGPFGF